MSTGECPVLGVLCKAEVILLKTDDPDLSDNDMCNYGVINIISSSDIDYVVTFSGRDDVKYSRDLSSVRINNPELYFEDIGYGQVKFRFFSTEECDAFGDSISECQEVCAIALRLLIKARDMYFSGFSRGIKEINQDSNEEIAYINQTSKELDIFNEVLDRTAKEIFPKQVESKRICTYCQCDNQVNPRVKFFSHTVVPFKANGTPIDLCGKCFKVFTFYREIAIESNSLIFEGEKNEEICSFCSATPEYVTMCSGCPCSFCIGCLQKLLDEKELKKMKAKEGWQCMNCDYQSKQKNSPPIKKSKRIRSKKKCQSKINSSSSSPSPRSTEKASPAKFIATATGKTINRRNSKFAPSPPNLPGNKNSTSKSKSRNITISVPPPPPSGTGTGTISVSTDAEEGKSPSLPSPTELETSFPPQLSSTDLITVAISPNNNNNNNNNNNKRIHVNSKKRKLVQAQSTDMSCEENSSDTNHQLSPNAMTVQIDPTITTAISSAATATSDELPLPPIDVTVGDVHFWKPYVENYENQIYVAESGVKLSVEEVCFLCKDGGDLLLCDYKCRSGRNRQCRKAYHGYCLSKAEEEAATTQKTWYCPRHFCSICGGTSLVYLCRYCPLTVCDSEKCLAALHVSQGEKLLLAPKLPANPSGEYRGRYQPFVCLCCKDVLKRCHLEGDDMFSWLTSQISSEE